VNISVMMMPTSSVGAISDFGFRFSKYDFWTVFVLVLKDSFSFTSDSELLFMTIRLKAVLFLLLRLNLKGGVLDSLPCECHSSVSGGRINLAMT
jgi:hypothetical protein